MESKSHSIVNLVTTNQIKKIDNVVEFKKSVLLFDLEHICPIFLSGKGLKELQEYAYDENNSD